MREKRTNLVLGILLIAVGGWMILTNQVPALKDWIEGHSTGAVYTIGAGLLILLIGLLTNAPGMAIPASIVAGVGGILYYQDMQKDYSSWSYMWTLIFAFIGFGIILAGLLGERNRNFSRGLRLIVFSGVLFLVFGTLLGGLPILGSYGTPILIILLGLFILARGFMRRGGDSQNETR